MSAEIIAIDGPMFTDCEDQQWKQAVTEVVGTIRQRLLNNPQERERLGLPETLHDSEVEDMEEDFDAAIQAFTYGGSLEIILAALPLLRERYPDRLKLAIHGA